MKHFYIKLLSILFFCGVSSSIHALGTYFYVGGNGATINFSTGSAWSTTPGGAAIGGTITPDINTFYYIDGDDVSSTAGNQPGTNVNLSMSVATSIHTLIVRNNNIAVTLYAPSLSCGGISVQTGATLTYSCPITMSQGLTASGNFLAAGNSNAEVTFSGFASEQLISGGGTATFEKFTINTNAKVRLLMDIHLIGNYETSTINGTLDAATYIIRETNATQARLSIAGKLKTANPLGAFKVFGSTVDTSLTLTLQQGDTIEFNGTGVQDIWCHTLGNLNYYNIRCSGSGIKRLVNPNVTQLFLYGSLIINAGVTLDVSSTQNTANIKGIRLMNDFVCNGDYKQRSGKLIFSGSVDQKILTTNDTLNDLRISGSLVYPASEIYISDSLVFTSGSLRLGNYNITLTRDAAVAGAGSSRFAVTNGTGEFRKVIPAGGMSFQFPVGAYSQTGYGSYTPVTLDFTALDAEKTIGVRTVDAQHPNDNSTAQYISRYWRFNEYPAGGTYTYNAYFAHNDWVGYTQLMAANYIYLPNTTWIPKDTLVTNTTMTVLNETQLTAPLHGADVTARINTTCTALAQPGAFTQSTAVVCAGQTGYVYTIPPNPSPGVTYVWLYSGNGATINGSGNSVTIDFAANATLGYLNVFVNNGCALSTQRQMQINPQSPVTVTYTAGPLTMCEGDVGTYTVTTTNASSAALFSIVNGGATINATTGAVSNVTANFTVRASATGTCGTVNADRPVAVTLWADNPVFVSGNTISCIGDTGTYIATASNATNLTYSIVNGGAIINAATGFVSNITGNFTVRATATGQCGPTASSVFTVTVLPAAQTPLFISGQQALCAGQTDVYTAVAPNATGITYSIVNGGAIVDATTGQVGSTTGSFIVRATATGSCGNATTADQSVTVYPEYNLTIPQVICPGSSFGFNGDVLTADGTYYDTLQTVHGCDSLVTLILSTATPNAVATVINNTNLSTGNFASYQWLHDGQEIQGAENQNYTATASGSYSVVVTDANGCTDTSNIVSIIIIGVDEVLSSLTVYPNPATNTVFIRGENLAGEKLNYTLTDVTGRVLTQQTITAKGMLNESVDISGYAPGVYLLTLSNATGTLRTIRVVKAE